MFHPTKAVSWVKQKFSPGVPIKKTDPAELEKLLWTGIEDQLKQYLKSLIEQLLKAELDQYLGAQRYERAEERKDYRNGSYGRTLGTKHGTIADVRVPRTRSGAYDPKVFERYERRSKHVDELIGTLFLNGVSTRKLSKIAKNLLGVKASHATIGHIAGQIIAKDCLEFQEKVLKDEYRFVFLDGISAYIREIGVERGVLLCAVALKHDGTKEIIGARLADSESEKCWTAFLVDLKTRGLAGKKLELITTDGGSGLVTALKTIYPFKPHQRCIAHKLRNVAAKLKMSYKAACLGGAKLIFAAQSRTEAIGRFKAWKAEWEVYAEATVHCMEKDLHECLTYYQFEKEVWRKIRTTNAIERAFREVRRRTRPMSIALPPHATERLFTGIAKNLNANWKESLLESTQDA
jgi:transposase-like protein